MPFPFTCPHCGNFTQVADHLAGSVVPCLACGASVELPPPVPEPSAETANADPAGLVFANEPGAPLSTGAQISKGAGVKKRSKGLKIKIAIAGVIAHVVVISVGVWLLVWQSSGPAETTTTKPVTQAPRTQPAPAPMPSPNPSRVKDEYATIILENLPEDADVFVDDALKLKTKGKTTEELRVTAGKQHQIRVKKEGYQDFEKSVPKIDADGRIHIAVELKPNPPPDSGFSPILNKSSHPDWRIVDGILGHFGPPATNTLLTKRDDYKDFILRLELRLRKPGGNSYVIFRHTLQNYYLVKIDDKRNGQLVWAQRDPNRANVLQEGIAEPLDQWIKLEIRAVENRLNIIVNDRSLTDYVDDKNAAGGGQIGLHVDNQNVEFRNIEVKVLASASAPKGIAIERRGWTPHLNGKFEAGFPSRAGFRRVGAGLLADGGNQASEDAVARGLKWLAKQQHKGDEKDPLRGSWATDGTTKSRVAGTGLAVLAFLAAGYTDRVDKAGADYRMNVENGVGYLVRQMRKPDGDFGTQNMYEHAIATMALCEFYGMTKDNKLSRDKLIPTACQLAVDFIIKAQHPAGGWRYLPGQAGDTSVTGWQIQALRSAHLAGIAVPQETILKATAFLDSVQTGQTVLGSAYRYTDRETSTPATTAAGLLCRQYLGWDQKDPALVAGIEELNKRPPPAYEPGENSRLDIYSLYYATQVIHNFGGPNWHKFWNPKMRDLLLKTQVGLGHAQNGGSWDPSTDPNDSTARVGGRLVTTCLALLTLEVYYRYSPLYKNESVAEPKEEPKNKQEDKKPPDPPKPPKPAVPDEKEAARALDLALAPLAAAVEFNSKGQYDKATKKYDKAIEDLKNVVAKYPDSEEAKKARAELKNLTEQFEKVYKERPNTDGGKQAAELLKKLAKGD